MDRDFIYRSLRIVRGDMLLAIALTKSSSKLTHHTAVFEAILTEVIEFITAFEDGCPDLKGATYFLLQYKLQGYQINYS